MAETPSDNSLKVLSALEAGQYEVFYTAPKCVEEHKHNDGSAYYVVKSQRSDRGGVKISVCGFEYILKYQDYFSAWEGPEADNPELSKALSQRVIQCWGPCIESADIICVYQKAKHLKGVVEWYDECFFEFEKLEEFLDDEVVRYKLMEIIGDYEIPDGWIQPLADGGEGADVIVFGTPAYFYSCTGQLKVLFDRTVAIYPDLPNKQYYYLLAQGDENKNTFAGTIKSLDGFLDCYEDSKFKGMVAAPGIYEKGAIKGTKYLVHAYKLGLKVK